ncbi:MAG: DinB family protein [Gemmatimonadales bacterium]
MDKHALTQTWDQIRQKYGVYLRLLEVFPADRLNTNPVTGMRTPAQLVAHVSGTVIRDIARGIAKGEITADESGEDTVAAGWKSKEEMIVFARTCWDQASVAVAATGDAQLNAMVPTPWHMTFPGWVGFNIMTDEFLHHRGQLYAYARCCGVEPPFMWGFDQNAPAFRPTV